MSILSLTNIGALKCRMKMDLTPEERELIYNEELGRKRREKLDSLTLEERE